MSTTSFHATKPFHTIEGGAVFTKDPELLKKMAYMRNFGHDGPEKFNGVGINGKNSEFHAAMGLCNLKHIDKVLSKRKEQSALYDKMLKPLQVTKPMIQEGCQYNYAYYPLIFASDFTQEIFLTDFARSCVLNRLRYSPPNGKCFQKHLIITLKASV